MSGWPPPALVLCAGLGTRLRPLTTYRAKPAMPVGDDTLIGHILRQIAAAGITEAILNLHHLPHTVTREVGDGSQYGIRVRYSWEQPRVLGSAGGPRHALPLVDGATLLIVNGDTLCDLPIRALWEAHRDSGALVTLGLMPHPEPGRYGGVTLDVDPPVPASPLPVAGSPFPVPGSPLPVPGSLLRVPGSRFPVAGSRFPFEGPVTGFVPRTSATPSVHFPGIQFVQCEVLASLPDDTPAESVLELYPRLMAERPGSVRGAVFEARFDDVGTVEDYRRTCRAIAGDAAGNVIAADAVISPTARLRRCIVWPGAHVPADCECTDAVITGRVALAPGARLDNDVR